MGYWRIDTISPADGLAFASWIDLPMGRRWPRRQSDQHRTRTVFIGAPYFIPEQIASSATADGAEARDFAPGFEIVVRNERFEAEFESLEQVSEVVRRLYNGTSGTFGRDPPTGAARRQEGPRISGGPGGATVERTHKAMLEIARSGSKRAREDFLQSMEELDADGSAGEIARFIGLIAWTTLQQFLDAKNRDSQDDRWEHLYVAGLSALFAATELLSIMPFGRMKEDLEKYFPQLADLEIVQTWMRDGENHRFPTLRYLPMYGDASAGLGRESLEYLRMPWAEIGGLNPANAMQCLNLWLSDSVRLLALAPNQWGVLLSCALLYGTRACKPALSWDSVADDAWRRNLLRSTGRWLLAELPVLKLPDGVEETIHDVIAVVSEPAPEPQPAYA